MRFIIFLAVTTVQCLAYPGDGFLPVRPKNWEAPLIAHHDDQSIEHPQLTEPIPLPFPLPPIVELPMILPPIYIPQRPEHGHDHHEHGHDHELVGGIPLVAEFGTYPTAMLPPYPNMFLPMIPSFEPFPYNLPANHPLFGKPPGSLPLTPEVSEPY